jgi:hypothetical protein
MPGRPVGTRGQDARGARRGLILWTLTFTLNRVSDLGEVLGMWMRRKPGIAMMTVIGSCMKRKTTKFRTSPSTSHL